MLRESVAKALVVGSGRSVGDMRSWWTLVREIGWGQAFAADTGHGLGLAEAATVAEECGRAAAPLGLPALVTGLAAAERGEVAAGGCVVWAPEPVGDDDAV